jgi:hypothetical protein
MHGWPSFKAPMYARCPYCGDQYPYFHRPAPGYCFTIPCIEKAIKDGKLKIHRLKPQQTTS